MSSQKIIWGAFVGAVTVMSAGCGNFFAPIYAGQIRGTDAAVALTTDGERTTVYSCGGAESVGTLTHWFEADGDPLRTELGADRWRVDIEHADGATIEGALVEPNGDGHPFVLAATYDEPLTRLYAQSMTGCRMGVIAYAGEDGEGRVQGAYCDDNGVAGQVTPVDIGPDMALVEFERDGMLVQSSPDSIVPDPRR